MGSHEFDPSLKPEVGTISEFDFVRLYVANAFQASSFYTSRLGFRPLAFQGLETGSREYSSYVVELNKVRLVFTSPLSATEQVANQHIQKHGDGVQEVAFTVDDTAEMMRRAEEKGATVVCPVTSISDENGTVVYGSLKSYGDVVMTFVQRDGYTGPFLPGYTRIAHDDPINRLVPVPIMTQIDHVVGNQPDQQMDINVQWVEQMLDFHKYWSADETIVHTEYSSLRATFLANWAENVILAITEPAQGIRKSQIQEFVDFYGGPGVQHIAILTEDLVSLVRGLRRRGCKFLEVPDEYYTFLEKRLENCPYDIQTDIETLKELRILVDYDNEGFLLQIFTECMQDRPCLFIEFIERHKSRGFGVGNFKALFTAVEAAQRSRGNLI